ncbi:hypothetical protein [Vibrio ziniensis]|uniref:Uncharacterized protein n=1 Tax=Vibrio ziniensis TaxID=2711221 RepID=A0A6G7CQZ8_9VIBR|nr:hypothetical protein G5S32_15035 [Vibrio ziniensis]
MWMIGAWLFSFSVLAQSNIRFSGQFNLEYRYFFVDGDENQDSSQTSAYLLPEWNWRISKDSNITFIPFYRYDEMDDERTHADIRELHYLTYWGDYSLKIGLGKVFWGVAESEHLVDVINQTDAVESIDGEDKLGQPMINLTVIKDWGVTEWFILPYFRERTFSGEQGRLRTAVPIDTNHAQYESSSEEKHVDYAFRYSTTLGDWDIGVSYMDGTDREPYFIWDGVTLVPYYPQMKHVGLDVQGTVGDWLWKLETVYKNSSDEYVSGVGGFEYTVVGALGTIWDIGMLAEYLYDSRGENSYAVGQNDLFTGFRLALNDAASSELLFGMTQDLDNSSSQYYKLEASTRLTNSITIAIEAWFAETNTQNDPLYSLRNDDFVQASFDYYF